MVVVIDCDLLNKIKTDEFSIFLLLTSKVKHDVSKSNEMIMMSNVGPITKDNFGFGMEISSYQKSHDHCNWALPLPPFSQIHDDEIYPIQWHPLTVITLGPGICDHMITSDNHFYLVIIGKWDLRKVKTIIGDNINRDSISDNIKGHSLYIISFSFSFLFLFAWHDMISILLEIQRWNKSKKRIWFEKVKH